jgi:ABC-2 type transport system permease protein
VTGTGATTIRVLRQLRHDPRTVVLLLVVPSALMTIFRFVYDRQRFAFALAGPPLMVIFPLFTMFLVSSIAVLRERTSGTLERLMTMPLHKIDIVAGYAVAFALVAVVQATVVSLLALGLLGLEVAGPNWLVVVLAVANAILGSTLGLFVSAFAETEFQAVQFMPAVVLPQILLCGLFVPRDQMAAWLRAISYALPLTYAYDALARTAANEIDDVWFAIDCLVVIGSIALAIAFGAATLRRRTA